MRTVRSAARSRNGSALRLAWLIILALGLLLLAATRVAAAAPADDALAIRYANAITNTCTAYDEDDDGDDDADDADGSIAADDAGLAIAADDVADDADDADGGVYADDAGLAVDAAGASYGTGHVAAAGVDADDAGVAVAFDDTDHVDDADGARRCTRPRGVATERMAAASRRFATEEPELRDADTKLATAGTDTRSMIDPSLDASAPSFETLADSDDDGDVAELDWLDEPTTREAIDTGLTFASTAFVDAAELRDIGLRHHRPSRWGRVDLSVAWRRAWNRDAMEAKQTDVLWLVATWRR